MDYLFESARLVFRKITPDDLADICEILQDEAVMYAWEHAFSMEEVVEWINKNLERYATDGFGFFAAIQKETGQLVGVIGPLVEEIESKKYIGVAYILKKSYWHQGYAVEGAKASIDYAFTTLKADKVIAPIRPENIRSRKVAEKLGMQIEGECIKHYRGKEMPHLIYSLERQD